MSAGESLCPNSANAWLQARYTPVWASLEKFRPGMLSNSVLTDSFNSAIVSAARAAFSAVTIPLRQLRKTLFSQTILRKEPLFYRVFRSKVCGKVRFFEVPLR